ASTGPIRQRLRHTTGWATSVARPSPSRSASRPRDPYRREPAACGGLARALSYRAQARASDRPPFEATRSSVRWHASIRPNSRNPSREVDVWSPSARNFRGNSSSAARGDQRNAKQRSRALLVLFPTLVFFLLL